MQSNYKYNVKFNVKIEICASLQILQSRDQTDQTKCQKTQRMLKINKMVRTCQENNATYTYLYPLSLILFPPLKRNFPLCRRTLIFILVIFRKHFKCRVVDTFGNAYCKCFYKFYDSMTSIVVWERRFDI